MGRMWSTTPHFEDDELMLAADGELEPRRKAALDAHAAGCAVCRTRRDEMAAALEQVSALLRSEPAPTAAASPYGRGRLEGALRAAAQEDGQRWRILPFAPTVRIGSRLALGAAVMLIMMAGALFATRATRGQFEREMVRAALPVPELTPGAVSTLSAEELCAGVRPSRLVPDATRRQVLNGYGMQHVSDRVYELDALVTPELGGTTDAANLWPQRYQSPVWNARVKDELEDLLPQLVCSGRLELSVAQRTIAGDWIRAYQQFFQTDRPLQAHLTRPVEEGPELILLPPVQVVADAGPMVRVAWRGR